MKTIPVFLLQARLFNLLRRTICRSVSSCHCFFLPQSVLHTIWTKYRMSAKQMDVDKSRMHWVWFSKEDIKCNTEQEILNLLEKILGVELIAECKKPEHPRFYVFFTRKASIFIQERDHFSLMFPNCSFLKLAPYLAQEFPYVFV